MAQQRSGVHRVVFRVSQAEVEPRAAVPCHLTGDNDVTSGHHGCLQHSVRGPQAVGLEHDDVPDARDNASKGHDSGRDDLDRRSRRQLILKATVAWAVAAGGLDERH